MSSIKEIKLVDDFHPRPKGRYADDAPGCENTAGEVFRKNILIKAMKDEKYDKVIVDLTGYNRYGRSFLAEAFAGLISREGLTKAQLDAKLEVKHDTNQNFIKIVNERIEAAEVKRTQDV
ncbi:STAS-like domain-containing protein [Vibrio parahaemolyticus]|nr:STAS-like domain-containing protein [Vibrio parahaemolyticus]